MENSIETKSDTLVKNGFEVESSFKIIAHGPMGSAPFSRIVRISINGQSFEVETKKFPTDYAASCAARDFYKAFLHTFDLKQ